MPEMIPFLAVQENDNLYTSVLKTGLQNRILVLNDEVNDCLVENFSMYIFFWNMEDKDLPKEKRQPIKLVINSCGGDTFQMMQIISLIENSITPIIGIAMSLVASAAYDIYVSCHTRVAFKNSTFLMHNGSLTISNSTNKCRNFMDFTDEMEERTKQHILKCTNISEELYDEKYDDDFYFYADAQGKELGVVDLIIGEDIQLDELFD